MIRLVRNVFPGLYWYCVLTAALGIAVVNRQLCEGVPDDRSRINAMIIVQCTFGGIALICILLRSYSRLRITKQMGADDWTMLSAGIILAAVFALNFYSTWTNFAHLESAILAMLSKLN